MRINKTIFILMILIVASSDKLFSQIGGYAGSYLHLVPGARAQGLGGAYVAAANDVTAGFWNPAGLGRMEGVQLCFMWSELSLDRQYNYAAMAIPTNAIGAISLSWLNYQVAQIEKRDETSKLLGNFSNEEYTMLFSWGANLNSYLSMGATVKMLFHSLADYHASGVGYDIGFQFFPSEKLSIGASVQNISTAIKWSHNKDRFLKNTRIGILYRLFGNLNLCFDYEWFSIPGKKWTILRGQYDKIHVGGEYHLLNKVIFRAGLDNKRLAVGFSLPVLNSNNSLELGYGLTHDPVDDQYFHKLEVLFKFQTNYTASDITQIPGNRIYAAIILEINSTTLCIDLGEEHELKSGTEVTIYKKNSPDESHKLTSCCAEVTKIKKREAILSLYQREFLSDLVVGQKIVVAYNII